MTERPILFSGPMVKDILEGRKTQTRRVLKPQPVPPAGEGGKWHIFNRHGGVFCDEHQVAKMAVDYCPIAEGDELWVRERHFIAHGTDGDPDCVCFPDGMTVYETGQVEPDTASVIMVSSDKWRPSIHMPRWASRITLRVTAVKVERLNSISEEDAKAEGVEPHPKEPEWWRSYASPDHFAPSATLSFATLWESINGPGSWDANPWVAAYTFERIKP